MGQNVSEVLFNIIRELVLDKIDGSKESEVVLNASFKDDLGADSLAVVELIMGIEDRFGITIPDEIAEKIVTVGQAVTYVQSQLEEKDSL